MQCTSDALPYPHDCQLLSVLMGHDQSHSIKQNRAQLRSNCAVCSANMPRRIYLGSTVRSIYKYSDITNHIPLRYEQGRSELHGDAPLPCSCGSPSNVIGALGARQGVPESYEA